MFADHAKFISFEGVDLLAPMPQSTGMIRWVHSVSRHTLVQSSDEGGVLLGGPTEDLHKSGWWRSSWPL